LEKSCGDVPLKLDFRWLVKNVFFGIIYGLIFVLANLSTGFSIGLPLWALSASSSIRSVVVIGLAPIVEDLFFLLVLVLTYYIFKKNKIAALIATSILFGVYHLVAYQGQIGSLISAMVFRAAVVLIYWSRKADFGNLFNTQTVSVLVSVIIMHAVFNAFILNKLVGLVVAG
jgi:hypothetical protein